MIHGIPCVYPADGTQSLLDTPIDIDIADVSLVEVFAEVFARIACGVESGTEIPSPYFYTYSSSKIPESLLDSVASLDLEDVSAREAVCAAVAQSPMELDPILWQKSLVFLLRDRSGPLEEFQPMSTEERHWVEQTMSAAVDPAIACDEDRSIFRLNPEPVVFSTWDGSTDAMPVLYEVFANNYYTELADLVVNLDALEEAEEQVRAISNDTMRLEIIQGFPCIRPAGDELSDLDTKVSLQLKGGSIWSAVKSILRQMNCEVRYSESMRPPDFFSLRCPNSGDVPFQAALDLDLRDVTAREALCAVAAHAPVQMRMEYKMRYLKGHLGIFFCADGQRIRTTDTPWESLEQAQWWANELHEATLPAEECSPTPDEQAAEQ